MHTNGMPENPNESINYSGRELAEIYLAGGCFWGEEAFMRRIAGVADTECGYANGTTENPTYEEVCTGTTAHVETVRVRYAPELISIPELLDAYLETTNPAVVYASDDQYRNGLYFVRAEDEAAIRAFVDAKRADGVSIEIEILPLKIFCEAEEYHQDYLEKNPGGFCHVDLTKLAKRKK